MRIEVTSEDVQTGDNAQALFYEETVAFDAQLAAEWQEFEDYCDREQLDPGRLASLLAWEARPRFSDDPEGAGGGTEGLTDGLRPIDGAGPPSVGSPPRPAA